MNEPTIVRYVCIRVGRWKLENWHVYQYRQHRDAKTGKNRWMMWDKIF